jgi:hypothetical protein
MAAGARPDEYQTAYLILGHGMETDTKCRVPPGCCVVVDAQPGEAVIVLSNFQKMKPFFEYTDKRDEREIKGKFLNPIRNYLELTESISTTGSLAIYREGQLCPDFKYVLFDYHIFEEASGKEVGVMDSGIVEYPFYKREIGPLRDITIYKDKFTSTSTHPITKLVEYYDKSIYPRMKDVREFIKTNAPLGMGIATFAEYIMSKSAPFVVTQKELFDLVKSGKFKPGVFYNMVCRSTTDDIIEQSEITRRFVVKNSLRRLLPKANKLLIPELSAAIEEAEWHRKPFLRNAVQQKFRRKVAELEGSRQEVHQLEKLLDMEKKALGELEHSDKPNKNYNIRWKKHRIYSLEHKLNYLKGKEGIPFLEKQLAAWNQTRRNRPGRWKKTASGRHWTLKKDNEA